MRLPEVLGASLVVASLAALAALAACGGGGGSGGAGTPDAGADLADDGTNDLEGEADALPDPGPEADAGSDAADADAEPELPPSCEPPCPAGQICTNGICACPAGWTGEACDLLEATPIPWSEGPYDTGIMDQAGDFLVQTLDGDGFDLAERWTGRDSYLFVFKLSAPRVDQVWNTDVALLFEGLPRSAHLFFGSYAGTFAADVAAMRTRVETALASMAPEDAAHWRERVHYIVERPFDIEGSLGAFLTRWGGAFWAIDRFGRWRQVGSLYDWRNDRYTMAYLANELRGFEYEAELDRRRRSLLARETVLEIPLWEGVRHEGGWGGGYSTRTEVALPSGDALAAYDALALDLYTACPGHQQGKDAGCNEWDYIEDLKICDRPADAGAGADTPCQPEVAGDPGTPAETRACQCESPTGELVDAEQSCNAEGTGFSPCGCACGTELARWVTPYGREGHWLTDLTPLHALLSGGGTWTFTFGGANGYDLFGSLILWSTGTGEVPIAMRYLWGTTGGERFDETYNLPGKHPDVSFQVPEGTTRAELVAVISGHGHSSTEEGCAEFCNHQHRFTVNGQSYTRDNPVAGTWTGCLEQIAGGTVPNQFGTWPFGRGGWCPGLDIPPWSVDITAALVSGDNVISYEGLYKGLDYYPTITDPGGYLPEIKMTSWLVFYGARP